jgi:hypothetical protein
MGRRKGRSERERRREWVPSAHTPFLRRVGSVAENGEAKSVLR